MQKVVYVLLQQHAEKYWQMEHDDDEDDVLADGEMRYRDVRLNCKYLFFSFQSVPAIILCSQ